MSNLKKPLELREDFEPRLFQKEIMDKVFEAPRKTLIQLPRPRVTYIGVDMAEVSGDKTVIAQAMRGKNGITHIYFDEYADLPNYKWYRNPIKWLKWRRLMKKLEKQIERYKIR